MINGFLQSTEENQVASMGIIPMGTANDLADVLERPRDPTAAYQRTAAGNTRVIDIDTVNDHFFSNNSAVG